MGVTQRSSCDRRPMPEDDQIDNTPMNKYLVLILLVAIAVLMTPTVIARTSEVHRTTQQQEGLAKGVVIEKISSRRDSSKSYALYLPTSYSTNRKFPIIYCFDPVARGPFAVAQFSSAAEKYNYIVVGPNNSRNGPNEPLTEIVRDLWEETHATLSIDDRRVYVAGFSGGARVAISVAFWLKGQVAGVIACGGGFPNRIPLNTSRTFVLFATTGIDDFNNPEMQLLYRTLQSSAPPVRLILFDGGHMWLPVELATNALEWLELQAMKSGLRDKDEALIEAILQRTLAQANAAKEQDQYRAYLLYSGLSEDFGGLRDVTDFQKSAEELKNSKAVRDGFAREKQIAEGQTRKIEKIHSLIGAADGSDDRFESLSALRDALRDLRKQAAAVQASPDRTIARRVMESLFIEFLERSNVALAKKDFDQAIADLTMCTEIQPESARVFYQLGRAHVLAKDKKDGLRALETAAEKGFAAVKELEAGEFDELRDDKRFQEVKKRVEQNQLNKVHNQ
jgi:dienelactone hydrolase